eukprot:TRINITY_DN4889_c0_g1_i1.p1 TRINITY_DN4889_c0_g1~~TRINITY_DN4889_c0_g1_i1.p1  ORF type:complete len:797 (-),score=196.99 TRINITY_DN4889_c0_g1_i1:197-2494(-)
MEPEQISHFPPLATSILTFWFSGTLEEQFQRWFSRGETQSSLDSLITMEFGELLKSAEQGDLQEWDNFPSAYAAKIILVDQFSRHIYRNDKSKIKENDKLALQWSFDLITRGFHYKLPVNQHVFVLMPLRHSNEEQNLQLVYQHIQEREKLEESNSLLLERFKKTTLHKLYDAQNHKEISKDTEILERHPFDADETFMWREKLYRCVHSFLASYWETSMKYVIISLSGGVDSMVISKILVKLAPIMGFKVIAIHLDYGNRPESHLEADYVEWWCGKNGIIFRKRYIHEFQRATCDRDMYEKETKRIRFETYHTVLKEFQTETGIIFGHHKGDEQENIITNIMKGRESILNISGMFPQGTILGVKIWRPLLPYTKDYIFKFAHKYGVPYFLDTTPKWSNRGKLRNQVQPMLEDLFGSGYLNNLSTLGEDSTEMAKLAHKFIFGPFWRTLKCSEVAAWIDVSRRREESKLFWKQTLRHIFHKLGTSTLRDKSMDHFLKQLKAESLKSELGVWVSLKKENSSLLYRDYLIVFRDKFFPRDVYWPEKTLIKAEEITFYHPDDHNCGWKVTIEQVPDSEYKEVEIKIENILNCHVTYFLRGSEYYIDSNARLKSFRLIPKLVNKVMPVVLVARDPEEFPVVLGPGPGPCLSQMPGVGPGLPQMPEVGPGSCPPQMPEMNCAKITLQWFYNECECSSGYGVIGNANHGDEEEEEAKEEEIPIEKDTENNSWRRVLKKKDMVQKVRLVTIVRKEEKEKEEKEEEKELDLSFF